MDDPNSFSILLLPFFLYSLVVLCLDAYVNLTFMSWKTELSFINLLISKWVKGEQSFFYIINKFFFFSTLSLKSGSKVVEAWNLLMFTFLYTACLKFWTYTGCPKSSFLYFISLYFSTIELGKEIISTKVVSFNIIHYFHTCCAIFWLEYSICVLPRQRCPCASIFSSHIFFVFYSPNCSYSFLVFCEYHER